MATQLRRFFNTTTGKVCYLDYRLKEFRNVENPHDSFPIAGALELKPFDRTCDECEKPLSFRCPKNKCCLR